MDYYEFIEKTSWDVSRETYDNIIEPLYLKGPSDIIGVDVPSFWKWLMENDFSVGQLRQIAAIAEAYDSAVSKVSGLQQKVRELENEVTIAGLREQKLQDRLDAVIEMVGAESLVERMVDNMDTENIIDAWIFAKIVKQNSNRQVGQ